MRQRNNRFILQNTLCRYICSRFVIYHISDFFMCNYLLSGLGWFGLSDTNTLAIRSMSFLISGSFKTFAKMLGCCTISFKHSPIASWISRSAGNKSRAVNWEKSRIINARIWIVSFKKYLFWRFPCLYQNYSVYRSSLLLRKKFALKSMTF